ncbi:hypothetical protein HPP92_009171 [Vanilla planifolia]|uniref:Uncharacterized protein n=1 Tax=Vanilla planifolia TaxID=51239 RepID=A0A835V8L2_VANPL|nr:hypothetical protein HPP92_009171 [Vanilla planifolia]
MLGELSSMRSEPSIAWRREFKVLFLHKIQDYGQGEVVPAADVVDFGCIQPCLRRLRLFLIRNVLLVIISWNSTVLQSSNRVPDERDGKAKICTTAVVQ